MKLLSCHLRYYSVLKLGIFHWAKSSGQGSEFTPLHSKQFLGNHIITTENEIISKTLKVLYDLFSSMSLKEFKQKCSHMHHKPWRGKM